MKNICRAARFLCLWELLPLFAAGATASWAGLPPAEADRSLHANSSAAAGPFHAASSAGLASAPTKLGDFGAMRLPLGYKPQPYPTPIGQPGAEAFLFSKANPDGTRPVFFVLIAPIPADAKGQNSVILDAAVTASKVQIQSAWTSFHMSPVINGTLAGGPAKYVLYTGVTSALGGGKSRQVSAACYFACVGNIVIGVTSRDTAPYDSQSLRVAEAAVLSFAPRQPNGL